MENKEQCRRDGARCDSHRHPHTTRCLAFCLSVCTERGWAVCVGWAERELLARCSFGPHTKFKFGKCKHRHSAESG